MDFPIRIALNKILDFESLNGRKLIKKLTWLWHKKSHFFLFFFFSYLYIKILLPTLYLLIFISVVTPFPPPSLVSLVEEDGLEAGLEVWMISYAPQHSGTTVFSWKCSHRVALSPCTAYSTMGRVSWESLLLIPHTQNIRAATVQGFWPLQPSEITLHLSNL